MAEGGQVIVLSRPPDEDDRVRAVSPPSSDSGDSQPRCYVCMETAGSHHGGGETRLLAICRCSASGAMPICKECFVTWLERELERQGELAVFKCLICKEPYRLKRARKPARVVCYVLGERFLTGLFFVSFFTGCVIVAYIMVSLTALLSGHMATYRMLVGGANQSIFRAAEITLLFSFVVGSAAIVLTFLWHSFSPCGVPQPERRAVASVFDLKALDRLTIADPAGRHLCWSHPPLVWLRRLCNSAVVVPLRASRETRRRRRLPPPPMEEGDIELGPALRLEGNAVQPPRQALPPQHARPRMSNASSSGGEPALPQQPVQREA